MNKGKKVIMFLITIVFFLCSQPTNLVPNGNFEEVIQIEEKLIRPIGWKKNYFSLPINGKWEVKREGENNYLYLYNEDEEKGNIFWEPENLIEMYEEIKELKVSIKMKFNGIPREKGIGGEARLYIFWLDGKGNKIKEESIFVSHINDWRKFEKIIKVPDNTKKIRPILQLIGKGEAFFDDFSINFLKQTEKDIEKLSLINEILKNKQEKGFFKKDNIFVLKNYESLLILQKKENFLYISDILVKNKEEFINFCLPVEKVESIFKICIDDKEESTEEWFFYSIEERNNQIIFSLKKDEERINLKIDLKERNFFNFYFEVFFLSPRKINYLIYPYLNRIGNLEKGEDSLLIPYHFGHLIPDISKKEKYGYFPDFSKSLYPSMKMPLQMIAYFKKGSALYIATYDSYPLMKNFICEPNNGLNISIKHYPIENGEKKKYWKLEYPIVIGVLPNADWWEIAQIYKRWAINQKWSTPNKEKKYLSKKFAETHINYYLDVNEWYDRSKEKELFEQIKKVFEIFKNINAFVHLYNWHNNIFDKDIPQYFPPKNFMTNSEIWKYFRENNLYIMPYIHGIGWDIETASWQKEEAFKFSIKDENGNVVTTKYPWKKYKNGEIIEKGISQIAYMCPFTDFWQSKLYEITLKLHKEFNCLGVYFDVVGAEAKICYDKTHGHTPGNGSYIFEGYRKLIERIKKDLGKEFFITTESFSEPYLNIFDGFLMDMRHFCIDENTVPLVPAIYSGYWIGFNHSYSRSDWYAIKEEVTRSFHYGINFGGITLDSWSKLKGDLDLTYSNEVIDYMKRLINVREKYKEFFLYGEYLKPLKIKFLEGNEFFEYQRRDGKKRKCLSLWQSLWKRNNKILAVFTNISDKVIKFEFYFEKNFYFPDVKNFKVILNLGKTTKDFIYTNETLSQTLKISPYEIVLIEFIPKK